MKFNQSQISEIIQMAWDDQTDFSHIKKIYEIDEGDVKKIMKGINVVYHCAATAHEGLSVF